VPRSAGSIASYLNTPANSGSGFPHRPRPGRIRGPGHDIGHPPSATPAKHPAPPDAAPRGLRGQRPDPAPGHRLIFFQRAQRRGMNPTRAFIDGVLKVQDPVQQWDESGQALPLRRPGPIPGLRVRGPDFPATATGKPRNGFAASNARSWTGPTTRLLAERPGGQRNAGFVNIGSDSAARRRGPGLDGEDSGLAGGPDRRHRGGDLERTMNRRIGALRAGVFPGPAGELS